MGRRSLEPTRLRLYLIRNVKVRVCRMKSLVQQNKGRIQSRFTEESIRERAYQLYERRGRADGHDLEDWLRSRNTHSLCRSHAA